MDHEKNEDVQELMEEVAKELGYEWENKKHSSKGREEEPKVANKTKWKSTLVLIAAIVILSLIIQWAARSRTSGQYKKLSQRLNALEARIGTLETKMAGPSELRAKLEKLSSQVGGIETSISTLAKRMDELSRSAKSVKKKSKSRKSASISRTYVVKRGDSFFRIAKKYGVSIASLCRANGLSSKSVLHPGQKLIIPSK